ncbi:hypothetical protein [Desulfonema magnum]|uniref:Uncharacterized protein n=1 Tax=Desulfonema magnum TaxID=45655 RepID=A0A975GKL5_9BACT|nr:hypothetical protein [Desulfonema magnum]QTA84851.1 Uncharacterized protein dnm_008540 [Desulfonema magnum]
MSDFIGNKKLHPKLAIRSAKLAVSADGKFRQTLVTLVPTLCVGMPSGRFASRAAGSFVTRSVSPAFPREASLPLS